MSRFTAVNLQATSTHTDAHADTFRTNSTASCPSSSRAERQYTQRPIQLRDPPETSRSGYVERPASKARRKASAGYDLDHIWSWVHNLTRSKSTKSNEQCITNTCSVSAENPQSLATPRLPSNMHRSTAGRTMRSSGPQRPRQARLTAKDDLVECNASRYSLWEELKHLFQYVMQQRAEEKARLARRRAREGNLKVKTIRLTSATPTYKTHISNNGRPAVGRSEPPRKAMLRQQHGSRTHSKSEITREPLPTQWRGLKEVSRHAVQIAHLPPIHKSVHVKYSTTENSATTARKRLEHRPSHDTTMGSFMAAIDKSQLRKTINETTRPRHGFRPCDVCGAGASPGSGRTSKGLWLCSICRNPEFPFAEIPPRADSQHTPVSRHCREDFQSTRPGNISLSQPRIDESNIHPAFRQNPSNPQLYRHEPNPPGRTSIWHDRPIPNIDPHDSHLGRTQPGPSLHIHPAQTAAPQNNAAASYSIPPAPAKPTHSRSPEPLKAPQRSSSVYPEHSMFHRRNTVHSSVPPIPAAYTSPAQADVVHDIPRKSFCPSTPRPCSAAAWRTGLLHPASEAVFSKGERIRERESRGVNRRSSFYGFWKRILGEYG